MLDQAPKTVAGKNLYQGVQQNNFAFYEGRNWHEWLLTGFRTQVVASIMGDIPMYDSLNMADTIAYTGTKEEEAAVQAALSHHTRELGKIIQAACLAYISDNNLIPKLPKGIVIDLNANNKRLVPIHRVNAF